MYEYSHFIKMQFDLQAYIAGARIQDLISYI
jgi:hypothetical protein